MSWWSQASDKESMATYSYVLCSKCGGTGHAGDSRCPRCEGARMTGSFVDERLLRLLEVESDDLIPAENRTALVLEL